MSYEARVDVDVIFHNATDSTFELGNLSDHQRSLPSACETITGSIDDTPENISAVSASTLSTLAVKNTGSSNIVLAGVITVPPNRMAVLPVTATVTVEAPSGSGQYSAVWVG